jgi:hypothetical protein
MEIMTNYPSDINSMIMKYSGAQFIAFIERMKLQQEPIETLFPFMAMILTTNDSRSVSLKGTKLTVPSTTFAPMSRADIFKFLLPVGEAKRIENLTSLLNDYISNVSSDMLRRQLAYHVWAAASITNNGAIASARPAMVPTYKQLGISVPFSLLLTPAAPITFVLTNKSLSSSDINDSSRWVRSLRTSTMKD